MFSNKTSDTPKVSIVVPVYNVEKYLRECLDSLLAQKLKDIEIIVVNDGSTDSSADIAAEYAARDSRVRLISKENEGYGKTMNRGFSEARGEYVGIVESDDFADPRMFKDMYKFAKKHDLDLVKANYYEHSDAGDVFQEPFAGFAYKTVFDPRVRSARAYRAAHHLVGALPPRDDRARGHSLQRDSRRIVSGHLVRVPGVGERSPRGHPSEGVSALPRR